MAKHTPGPWFWRPGSASLHVWTQDDPSNISTETHICGMSTDYMPIEEREANAALIAAAPDMYEALRHILEAIDTCGDDAVHYALANHQTLGDVVSEARAALAKARAAKAAG